MNLYSYVILSLTDLGNILYTRYLNSGTEQVTFLQIGSVKAIVYLWVWMKFCPHFLNCLYNLDEIQNKKCLQSFTELLWVS